MLLASAEFMVSLSLKVSLTSHFEFLNGFCCCFNIVFYVKVALSSFIFCSGFVGLPLMQELSSFIPFF